MQFAKAKKFPPRGKSRMIQKGVAGTRNSSILDNFCFSEIEFYKNNTQFQRKRGGCGPHSSLLNPPTPWVFDQEVSNGPKKASFQCVLSVCTAAKIFNSYCSVFVGYDTARFCRLSFCLFLYQDFAIVF